MTDKIKLKVTKRTVTGRKVKNLRQKGILPANIYGKDVKSLSVQLSSKDFKDIYTKAGETSIIEITVDKETKARPVLVHNIHLHPVTDEFLHADFHQVDLTKKVTVNVPIELTGTAPAVSKGGILLQVMDEIEVEALPTDLPEKFTINISKLEDIGQNISLKKLKLSNKVKLITDNLNELIVKIEEPTKEEEKPVEEVPAEGEEGEEGEAPAEGEEPKEGEPTKEGEDKKPEDKQTKPTGDSKDKKPEPKEKK